MQNRMAAVLSMTERAGAERNAEQMPIGTAQAKSLFGTQQKAV